MRVTVKEKEKTFKNNIDSAFLKADTEWRELVLEDIIPQNRLGLKPNIKIKLEIDTRPPLGFETEERLLLKPFSFYVKCFSAQDLFAGKMHALLFRKWKTNVKGRDWYDMEWYIKNDMPLHLSHFLQRATDSGDWKKGTINREEFIQLMEEKIASVSMDRIKADIIRFIPDPTVMDIWSQNYFKDLVKKLVFI